MTTYSISYDLDSPNRNYAGVIAEIKRLANGYCSVTESHWLINSNSTAAELCTSIYSKMDSGDKLIVHSVGNSWATNGMDNEVNSWLKNNWQSSCVA